MAFNVSSLPEYVDQHKIDLLSKSVYSAPTIKYLNIQTGIKHSAALNILDTNPTLQANTCGWNANGDATFTQRILEVGKYKVNMSLCERDLVQKFMNVQTLAKAGAEVLPYEEQITSKVVESVKDQVENLIWNATKASDAFDGILTIAKAEGTAVPAVEANADTYTKVLAVYQAIPVEILDRAVIFVGMDTFRDLVLDCAKRNALNAIPDVDKANLTMIFPQSVNTKVVAVSGLNGTGAILAADPANLYYGVDMQDDAEAFDLWYSKDNSEFRLKISFNAGTQIAFPDQVIYLV